MTLKDVNQFTMQERHRGHGKILNYKMESYENYVKMAGIRSSRRDEEKERRNGRKTGISLVELV